MQNHTVKCHDARIASEIVPPRRIGLFGGTFDPVHLGHVHLANLAREALALDEVRFVPCRVSPHKEECPPTMAEDRLEMLRRATADLPWAVVDDFEIASPEPSFSYRTAQAMADKHRGATLHWIMGADQWEALLKWSQPEILASLVEFIVLARGGQQPQPREGYRLHVVHGEHPASASEIRTLASMGGSAALPWLHPGVAEWIAARGLYRQRA